jgi:hypothetical protein
MGQQKVLRILECVGGFLAVSRNLGPLNGSLPSIRALIYCPTCEVFEAGDCPHAVAYYGSRFRVSIVVVTLGTTRSSSGKEMFI